LIITILSFAFVLGVLVFVHELGHFLAAKRVGIRVLKFQLGFNPTIFKIRRGDTEYGIGALPLGGYVKMAGENGPAAPTSSSRKTSGSGSSC
jgi:regulator of sigma E protease